MVLKMLRYLSSKQGKTVLVVTHDLSFVLNMCQRALWLDKGQMRFLGEAGACVREYVAAMSAISGNAPAPTDELAAFAAVPVPNAPELMLADKERLGDAGVRVERCDDADARGVGGRLVRRQRRLHDPDAALDLTAEALPVQDEIADALADPALTARAAEGMRRVLDSIDAELSADANAHKPLLARTFAAILRDADHDFDAVRDHGLHQDAFHFAELINGRKMTKRERAVLARFLLRVRRRDQ